MTDAPGDSLATAESLLAAVVANFTAASVALPARRIVVAGTLAAVDTDQLTVTLQRIYIGLPGQEAGTPVPWQRSAMSMQLLVQLFRKAKGTLANAPRRQMPSSTSLQSDATVYFTDAKLLAGALHAWQKTLPSGAVKAGPVAPMEQQGEFVGLSGYVDVLLG